MRPIIAAQAPREIMQNLNIQEMKSRYTKHAFDIKKKKKSIKEI